MIRLSEFGIPRRGWPGRRRAIARLVLEVVGLTAFLLVLFVVMAAVIVVIATMGDAVPRR